MVDDDVMSMLHEIRSSQLRLECEQARFHQQLQQRWMEKGTGDFSLKIQSDNSCKDSLDGGEKEHEPRIQCLLSMDFATTGSNVKSDYTSTPSVKPTGSNNHSHYKLRDSARKSRATNAGFIVRDAHCSDWNDSTPAVTKQASYRSTKQTTKTLYPKTRLHRFVTSTPFVLTFSVAIIANAIIIGAEVNHRANSPDEIPMFTVLQVFFFVLFVVELLLRVYAFKARFFAGKDARWNVFDTVMVGLSTLEIMEVVLSVGRSSSGGGISRVFRIVRMARVIRIFRVLRFCPQLRMMLFLILESVKQLGWLVVLLISFLYLFSVIFTMGFTEYVGVAGLENYNPHQPYAAEAKKFYGSVWKSLYTCFRSMAGGLTWGEAVEPLGDMDMGWFYVGVFLAFIVFAVLCFMNIVTGVFVDGALEKSKNDRDMVIEKQLNQKKAYIENLRDIFNDTDDDGSGTISREEFETYMSDERVQAYFASLKVDTTDISALFDLLDRDMSGEIEFQEFIDNLLHIMRAQAPEQIVVKILNENREHKRELSQFKEYLQHAVKSMEVDLRTLKPSLAELHAWSKSQMPPTATLRSPTTPFKVGSRFAL